MKNYKILENRPELSAEQLVQGMDFNKVKANAAIAKTAIVKAFILKCVLGLAVIGSGALVYKLTSRSEIKNEQVLLADPTKNTNAAIVDSIIHPEVKSDERVTDLKAEDKKPRILPNSSIILPVDSSTKHLATAIANEPVTIEQEPAKQEDKNATDSTVANQNSPIAKTPAPKTAKAITVKSCRIWNTANFCNIPETARFATSMDCDLVDFDYTDCQTANQNRSVTAVWLTISANDEAVFQLETGFKNIKLSNAGGKSQTPLMVGVSGNNKFFGSKFKARNMAVHYNKQMDIFLFFQTAKAGDTITIRNLAEARIE